MLKIKPLDSSVSAQPPGNGTGLSKGVESCTAALCRVSVRGPSGIAGHPKPALSQGQRTSELEHLGLRVAAVLERALERPLRLVFGLVAADGLHHGRRPAHLHATLTA